MKTSKKEKKENGLILDYNATKNIGLLEELTKKKNECLNHV